MELAGQDRSWDDRVQEAVDLGPQQLRNILDIERPPSREKYVLLLELICGYHQQALLDGRYAFVLSEERCRVVFNALRADPSFRSTKPERTDEGTSTRGLRRRRSALQNRGQPLISFYDIFRSSIARWRDPPEQTLQAREPVRLDPYQALDCSPVTKLIWDEGQDELYDGGAIHACAQQGLEKFLQFILGKSVLRRLIRNDEERVQVVFLAGPDTEFTPLGIAIQHQQLKCIPPLLTMKGASKFIERGKNVLEDGVNDVLLLHEVLKWTQSDTAVETDPDKKKDIAEIRAQILKLIVATNNHLLTQHNAQGEPAYKYALRHQHLFNTPEITNTLRTAIFQHLKGPDAVRRALYNRSGKEIGLDLSDFNYDSHHFEDFINDLEPFGRQDLGKRWCFEDTILYLNLPNLPSRLGVDTIAKLFAWLKLKGVRKIINLKLPDCSAQYDIEDFICGKILDQFEVLHFDWVRLDVELRHLALFCSRGGIGPLTTLHLYSCGGFEGLTSRELETNEDVNLDEVFDWIHDIGSIYLNLVDSPDTNPDDLSLVQNRRQAAISRRASVQQELEPSLREYDGFEDGAAVSWSTFTAKQRSFATILEDCESQMTDELVRCHNFLGQFRRLPSLDELHPDLRHCMNVFDREKVRVAIIDNGVDQMHFPLSQSIEHGASFVKAGGSTEMPYLPWYTAADAHGTQMAYLVHSMNPWCRLFPIRVGTLQKDIDVRAAVKAIEWAIDQQVDIISISWAVKKHSSDLEEAIRKAVQTHRILVFCSTADIGSQFHPDVYPANYDDVTAVSASNKFGWARLESCRDVHIMLGGEEIKAHGPKYMQLADSRISGSSVATALAAGLASLCLFLARMANPNGDGQRFKNRIAMLHVFRLMQESKDNRVIVPAKLFDDEFELPDDFQSGRHPPPVGLQKFSWMSISASIRANNLAPFSGNYPRRAISEERHRLRATAAAL